jgi:hypothetical protein
VFGYIDVVGRIVASKDVDALTDGTCVTLHGKRDFTDMIKVTDFEMG